jgi:HEPN domain-containing protein
MITQATIGRYEYRLNDVAAEYQRLAQEDESVGKSLLAHGHYRHATYFLVQAMEKYVRSAIFGFVNPNTEYFRTRTRTHDLDRLLEFLVEVVSANPIVQQQVSQQLRDCVLGGIRFGQLHNELRYPSFSERHQSYAVLRITRRDAEIAMERLQTLKQFLRDVHRLRE